MFNLSWYKVSIAKNIETVCGLTENKQTNKQTNKYFFLSIWETLKGLIILIWLYKFTQLQWKLGSYSCILEEITA